MTIKYQLLYIISIIIIINQTIASPHEKALHEYLFKNSTYNPSIRPVINSSNPINIDIKITVKRIFYVDEQRHKVTLYAVLLKKWTDELLKWNPNDFGGITYTYVDYNKIWTPKIELVSKYSNENNEASLINEVYDNFKLKLDSTGQVEFIPSVHLTTTCLFSYANFPTDIQMCSFLFQTPYRKDKLVLHSEAVLGIDSNSSMWDIVNMNFLDVFDPLGDPMNNLLVTLKRKIKSYIYTIPSYIIYTMTLIMFLLPQTSNQRIIIGAVCLVMTTILTYMLSNSLPHTDIQAFPLLGKLYLFNAVMIAFSIMFSSFIINLSQTDHLKSVPDWLRKLTLTVLSRIFCIKAVVYAVFNSFDQKLYLDETANNETNLNLFNQEQENTNINVPISHNGKMRELLKKIYDHMQQIRYNYQKYSYKHNINNEWLLIASLIDRILFLTYTFVILVSTLTILRNK